MSMKGGMADFYGCSVSCPAEVVSSTGIRVCVGLSMAEPYIKADATLWYKTASRNSQRLSPRMRGLIVISKVQRTIHASSSIFAVVCVTNDNLNLDAIWLDTCELP